MILSYDIIISKLEQQLGLFYDPQQWDAFRNETITILMEELHGFTQNEIVFSVDKTYSIYREQLNWIDFLEITVGWLNLKWTHVLQESGIEVGTMILLTDGSVLCQDKDGILWKRLFADEYGSYVNGSWKDVTPMSSTRLNYASFILADGRVLFIGGTYIKSVYSINASEIYNPVTDKWESLLPFKDWDSIYSAAISLLKDGSILVGNADNTGTTIYNPLNDTWAYGPSKSNTSAQECWVLLQDGCVLAIKNNESNVTQKYIPSLNQWVSSGLLPFEDPTLPPVESGEAIVLNDGRVFYINSNGNTAIYTSSSTPADSGNWSAGPDIPDDISGQTIGCKEFHLCLLANGHVLISTSPVESNREPFLSPTYFFEFNGSAIVQVANPPHKSRLSFKSSLLLLPTGQVMFSAGSNAHLYNYIFDLQTKQQPRIASVPSPLRPMTHYILTGTHLSGLSSPSGAGKNSTTPTFFPFIKIKSKKSGKICYCRTTQYNLSGSGKEDGVQTISFFVPSQVETGAAEISVIVNGNSSAAIPIEISSYKQWWVMNERKVNRLALNYTSGPLWILGKNGPVPIDPWEPDYMKVVKSADQKKEQELHSENDPQPVADLSKNKTADEKERTDT